MLEWCSRLSLCYIQIRGLHFVSWLQWCGNDSVVTGNPMASCFASRVASPEGVARDLQGAAGADCGSPTCLATCCSGVVGLFMQAVKGCLIILATDGGVDLFGSGAKWSWPGEVAMAA
ncbi:uncharacterized protein [Lolium perenne]|uniref:uncharacterized protein n=1 Tax=Lolium perenne TaxID=4522 RepID=UPI003A998359